MTVLLNPYQYAVTASPPSNVAAPVASGDLLIGYTLSCTTGTWTGTPTPTYTYQWRRNGSNIGGATSSTYVVTASDLAGPIDCVVTGTNANGSASADSNDVTVWLATSITGMAGWFDYSDASSLTLNGSEISQVNDKSGNARHGTQGTAAARPVVASAALNGLNGADFDGTDDRHIIPIAVLGATQPARTIAVVHIPDVTTTTLNTIANDGGGNNARTRVSNQAQNFGNAELTRASPTSGTPILHLARTPTNGASRQSRMKINSDAEVTSAAATRSATTTANASIGAFGSGGSGFYNGKILEILVYDTELSDANANKAISYLGGKYGLTFTTI